jgi:ankyrin repeat protein
MKEYDIYKIIDSNDVDLLKVAIEGGLDVNLFNPDDPYGSPLAHAILQLDYDSSIEMVSLLIQAGADPSTWTSNGSSNPLIAAMWGEHDEATRLLLEAGGDPNIKDEEGCFPLRQAVLRGNIELVQLLLKHGANKTIDQSGGADRACGMNPLGIAVNDLNIPMIQILLDAGANPESLDYDYANAFDRIPKDADPEIKELIENMLMKSNQST